MANPYKMLKEMAGKHNLECEEVIQILMASIFMDACDGCCDHFNSEEFFKSFDHLAAEMKLCKSLSQGLDQAA